MGTLLKDEKPERQYWEPTIEEVEAEESWLRSTIITEGLMLVVLAVVVGWAFGWL